MILFNEIEPFAAKWLANLGKETHIDTRSITQVAPADVAGFRRVHFFAGIGGWELALQLAGWPEDEEIWTGSCPCQPFSVAGKRGGTDDERHLWPEFFRLIKACRPRWAMGEQVSSKDGFAWLDGVFNDLEAEGYTCWAVDTCAAGVGAPHKRQRLYWVGQPNSTGREPRKPSAKAARYGSATVSAGRWSNAAIIHCRDGKSRPISPESGVFRVADGLSSTMGCDESGLSGLASDSSDFNQGVEHATQEERDSTESLQALRQKDGAEDVRKDAGGLHSVHQEDLLRQGVHGDSDGGRNEGREQPKRSPPVAQGGEEGVRIVRSGKPNAPRSSQGREWDEQRRRQFDYVVRALPSSLAFAELYGKWDEAKILLDLQQAIAAEKPLRNAPATTEEIWQSLPDEAKDRIAVCFGRRAAIIYPNGPLAYGIPLKAGHIVARLGELGVNPKTAKRIIANARRNRTGRLRGYGNAIVPQVAVEFVKSVMECV